MLIPDHSPCEKVEGASENCHAVAVLWVEAKGEN